MYLPIEVKPSAKRYYKDEEPQSNRLRGALLAKLGAHAETATMYVEPSIASLPAPELTPLDPYRDRGEDTLFVGDPRTINDIVSVPFVEESVPIDLLPLLTDLQRALASARYAIYEDDPEHLYKSLGDIRKSVAAVTREAETSGSSPEVSKYIDDANSLLSEYSLAA
ncbi:MAG: hypothetical protein WBB94_00555 [Candidatus Saccharimonadaceae bacterium]